MEYRPVPQLFRTDRCNVAQGRFAAAALLLTLQACGGGSGGEPPAAQMPANRAPVLVGLADSSIAEGATVEIEIAATDVDGGALSLATGTLPDFVTLEAIGAGEWRLSATPDFDDSGEYPITVTVSDPDGANDEATITLSVSDVNRAPALTSPGDMAVSEGQMLAIVLSAADADGDQLQFSGDNLPGFASITDNSDGTAGLNLAPGYFASGTYTVTVRVTDDGGLDDAVTFVVAVANINRAPFVTPVAPIVTGEGGAASIPLIATDPDADAIDLAVLGLPPFAAAFDNGDGTGGLTLAPGYFDSGTYALTVRATDASALTNEVNVTVTVTDVNRAPTLTMAGSVDINEDEILAVPIVASDADGDSISLSISGAPAFAMLNDNGDGTGAVMLNPGFADSGVFTLTLMASDDKAAFVESTLSLNVANVNRAPIITPMSDATLEEGETLILPLNASDPDDDALSLAGIGLPDFVSLTDNGDGTGSLDVQPDFDASGDYSITIRATDALSDEAETSFLLTVSHVNRPPTLAAISDQLVDEGTTDVIIIAANDPDGDDLTLEADSLPAFASLDDLGDGTGSILIAPSYLDSGTYPVVLRVRDTDGLIDEQAATITVSDINREPVLTLTDQVNINENSTISVPISASDPDGDALTLSMSSAPSFAMLTDNGDGSGTLQFQPGFSDSGVWPLSVRVTDSNGAFAESALSVDVANVNRAPTIVQVSDAALNEGESLMITLGASDPDGDALTFDGSALPGFVTLNDDGDGTGSLDVQPDFDAAGIYSITVSVADDSSAQADTQFFVTVGDVNRAPVLSNIANVTIAEGSDQTISLSASDPDSDAIAFETDNLPAFALLSDLGNGSAQLRITPALLDSGNYPIVVRVVDAGGPPLSDEQALQITVNLDGANHVAAENALPGTADWHLDNPALLREIEGYASATSVNRGETISFFVNTNAPTFTLEVFRTGWYQGIGARRMLGPVTDIPGTVQITPAPDPVTGLVEANWVNPYEIQTSDSLTGERWPTGVYLARLTESVGGKQSYIIFVVREDGHQHDVLFQLPVTTYQSYNAWGGKSIYGFNSGTTQPWGSSPGTRATHISFDRPYARNPYDPAGYGMGAGEYLTNVQPVGRIDGAGWDYNMVRWLEHEQYDVAYITNVDTHRTPGALLDTQVFLSQGHDEYWTWQMRDNVEAARDAGTDLAFFSSNAAYYQMRFEPSPTTSAPDRVMVVYKDALLDPVFNDANPLNDYLTTVPFRHLPIPRPEETLIGVQYVLDPYDGDIIVTNPAHWVFDKTGFVAGSLLEGLLGYEPDGIFDLGAVSNREVLAETPIVSADDPGNTGTSHMTIYSTPAASVFATGSLQWSWGLDDYNAPLLRTSRVSAMAQQVTENVLANFGALPYAGDDVVSAACVRIVSYSDATDDQTMAAAEFDLLDGSGQAIAKAGWSLHDFDSEETIGWDHRADYAIDDDPNTFWQTSWAPAEQHPHFMEIDLGGFFDISALRYVPRQDYSLDGTVIDYEIYTSPDCASWSLVASGGDWDASHGRKIARFELP